MSGTPGGDGTLHVLHVFSTFAVGGPQRRFADLVDGLGPGYRHTVVAMDGRVEAAELPRHPERVALAQVPVTKGRGLSAANLWRFRAVLRRLRPEVLTTYNWGAVEWALANRLRPRCRHVHVEDGFGPEEAGGVQLRRRVVMRRLTLSGRQTRVVVPSHTLRALAGELWRVPERRLYHIPNGVDCGRIQRTSQAVRHQRPASGEVVIGTVAALRPEKNLERLLRAFAMLAEDRRTRLVIAGDGPARPALMATAMRLGIASRVAFPGHVADPAGVLGELDIFALSSDTEQMPCSLMEAMAAGLPVVATDVGDVARMVASANRPDIVAPEDEAAFADRLGALVRDHGRRWSLGAANAAKAKTCFERADMLTRWDCLFRGRPMNPPLAPDPEPPARETPPSREHTAPNIRERGVS